MKNVALITNIPTPYRSVFFDRLSAALARQAIVLDVYYCALTEPRRHWVFEADRVSHRHEMLPGFTLSISKLYLHFNPAILNRLRRRKPDLIITAGSWNMPTALMALAWARLSGTKILFWSEGHEAAVRNRSGIVNWFRKRVYSAFDGFLVPNRRAWRFAASMAGTLDKLVVTLPNSIDDASFRATSPSAKRDARVMLGLPPRRRILLCVAYLEPNKGVTELARAYARLPIRLARNTQLIFLGVGSQGATIEEIGQQLKNGGQIHCPGHVFSDAVPTWLHAADIFCLNSFVDSNPLSVIEAAFAGKPLLISHLVGNVDEVIAEGRAGRIIADPNDPKPDLAALLESPDEALASMGAVALANAEEHFSLASISGHCAEALARVI